MALSLLPVSAFAAEPDGGSTTPWSSNQASVTVDTVTYYFGDFNKAVTYAQENSGCTLKLLSNIEITQNYTISNFTLDGAGFTISLYPEDAFFLLIFNKSAEITGGNFDVSVRLEKPATISGGSYTDLTTRDGLLTDYLANGCAFYNATTGEQLSSDYLNNKTYLSDVKVKESATPVCKHPNAKVTDGICECGQEFTASTTIEGADPVWHVNYSSAADTFKNAGTPVTLKLWKDCDFGYILSGTGTLDLNGKTLTARSGGITSSFGATMLDGTPLHTNITIEDSGSNGKIAGKVKIIFKAAIMIKGGTFDEISVGPDAGTVTLTGGTYGTLTVAAGKTLNSLLGSGCKYYDASGSEITVPDNQLTRKNVTVKSTGGGQDSPNDVAQVDGTNYTDLNEAINAAKASGKPVKLLKDIAESVTLTDAVTLNLNGKNITGTLTISNDGVMLTGASGTIAKLVITVEGKTLLDVLNSAFAYQKDGKIINGAKPQLDNVQIVLHSCTFDEASNTCACGRVKDTTPPVITLDDSNICGQGTESNMQYVEVKGNKLYFTVTDAETGIKSVSYNGTTLTPENGKYSIVIDDTTGKTTAKIVATNNAGTSSVLDLIAYRMVETKISQVWNGAEVVEICGESVATGHPVDEIRWIRATEPYSVKIKAQPSRINANTILELRPYTKSEGSYCAIRSSSSDSANYTYYFTTYPQSLAQYSQGKAPSFTLNDLKDIRIVRTKDTVAPTATITVRDVAYDNFSVIYYASGASGMIPVYDLFYKGPMTVDVTATDDNSGVQTVEYLFNDNPCQTAKQVNEILDRWQTLQLDNNGKAQFSLAANQKGYLYVRVTDEDGNVKIVNVSKGLVIYTDLQVTSADPTITLSLDEARRSDARTLPVNSGGSKNKVTIKCKDESGNDITMNPVFDAYPHNEYTVDSDGNIVLTAAFLRSRAVGTYTLTITIDPVGEKYKEADGNDKPTTVTVTLNVTKIKPTFTADNIPLSDKDFDGSAVNHPTIAPSITGGRNVRYEYKVKDADDNTYTTTPPTTAGDYVVKVTIEGDESYEAVTATKNFTISPKEVTITGTTVSNKVYNGNTDAVIANLGTLNGIVDSHNNVTIKDGSATFNNKNVGENKTVTFSGFTLEGADAKNYTLTAQPAAATASITPRLVTINGLAVDNKTYDGKPDATISADLTLTLVPVVNNADSGIVPNDDVTLNPTAAKAEFENKNAGADKPVTFSDFALTGADAGNYTLVLPTDVTATIERKTLTVDGLKIADKTYDGTKTAQWDGTPTLIGLVEGETLQLICGVPTFTSAIPGSNIPVTFTPFSLADGTGLAANYTLIQPVSGSITGNIVVNRHNHSRGPRPYLPQQPANGANGTNGGKDGVTSARTGDMGVALYAALSLASLSGTALLTRKRKETL